MASTFSDVKVRIDYKQNLIIKGKFNGKGFETKEYITDKRDIKSGDYSIDMITLDCEDYIQELMDAGKTSTELLTGDKYLLNHRENNAITYYFKYIVPHLCCEVPETGHWYEYQIRPGRGNLLVIPYGPEMPEDWEDIMPPAGDGAIDSYMAERYGKVEL